MTPLNSNELRKGFSSFATGVTVITCIDMDGIIAGVTINSFNTVSLEPPLILWSLTKNSRLMPLFTVGHKQLIHVLDRSQEKLAVRFAKIKHEQFIGVEHHLTLNGLAKISGCVAYFECETVAVHPGGDHNIIVAKVLSLEDHPDREPLIFARSKFVGLNLTESSLSQ